MPERKMFFFLLKNAALEEFLRNLYFLYFFIRVYFLFYFCFIFCIIFFIEGSSCLNGGHRNANFDFVLSPDTNCSLTIENGFIGMLLLMTLLSLLLMTLLSLLLLMMLLLMTLLLLLLLLSVL